MGAELKPGWVGCREWQGAQRFWTTRCACVNDTVPVPGAGFVLCGRSQIAIAAIARAHPTGIHQSV